MDVEAHRLGRPESMGGGVRVRVRAVGRVGGLRCKGGGRGHWLEVLELGEGWAGEEMGDVGASLRSKKLGLRENGDVDMCLATRDFCSA
jgi:hypothetical protein